MPEPLDVLVEMRDALQELPEKISLLVRPVVPERLSASQERTPLIPQRRDREVQSASPLSPTASPLSPTASPTLPQQMPRQEQRPVILERHETVREKPPQIIQVPERTPAPVPPAMPMVSRPAPPTAPPIPVERPMPPPPSPVFPNMQATRQHPDAEQATAPPSLSRAMGSDNLAPKFDELIQAMTQLTHALGETQLTGAKKTAATTRYTAPSRATRPSNPSKGFFDKLFGG